MKIGGNHRNKMWKSLLEFRQSTSLPQPTMTSQSYAGSSSAPAATCSVSPAAAALQNSFNPAYLEVTRYTFKHSVSLTDRSKREVGDQFC